MHDYFFDMCLLHEYIGVSEQALGWLPLDWDWL